MTRHHAESNINILLTKTLLIDSDVRQRNHSLIIPFYYLWAKSNNRTRGQFEYDVIQFWFCFDFVRSHARCGCYSIVCWRRSMCFVGGGSLKIGRPRSRGVG